MSQDNTLNTFREREKIKQDSSKLFIPKKKKSPNFLRHVQFARCMFVFAANLTK